MFPPAWAVALALAACHPLTNATPIRTYNGSVPCRQTKVVVLGAGVAGITAAQALANNSVPDFVIVEYNADIGGRVTHTTFGTNNATGRPYTVELGANWVQGLGSPGGPENPIWTLAKKWNLTNAYSNYSSILTYNETGCTDYSDLLDDYEDAYATLEQDAGEILLQNLQDRSVRSGLMLSGWHPAGEAAQQAVDWWEWDWEYAWTPEESSQEYGIVNYNSTFYQFSDENNYVFDERGFNAFIKGEASTFLGANDPRLLLNTVVDNITHSTSGVTIHNTDGTCVTADYAICTFSVGVLQNHAVSFQPALPKWKTTAIADFQMGTYTKIFLQFPSTFWDINTQFLLYASPTTRGYYPVWQSLSSPDFLPGSNILFVTVVEHQSYTVEAQTDKQTKTQVMAVLRQMFPNITVPEPTAFMYPRWAHEPWAYGSYSNWPPSTTLEMHQNLRANVGRLWFAGEATSAEYFGFLQGAWFEGREAGARIAELIRRERSCAMGNGTGVYCGGGEVHYEVLHGTTPAAEYNIRNGWEVTSFQTIGDV